MRTRTLVAIGAWIFLALALLHPPGGMGLPICPSRLMTERPCPGCGLTRSVSCAARGDLTRSWHYHPFGIVVLAAVLVIALVGIAPSPICDRAWEWAIRNRSGISRALAVYLVLMLIFGVARMAGLAGNPV